MMKNEEIGYIGVQKNSNNGFQIALTNKNICQPRKAYQWILLITLGIKLKLLCEGEYIRIRVFFSTKQI
jgi:hypothetical protein